MDPDRTAAVDPKRSLVTGNPDGENLPLSGHCPLGVHNYITRIIVVIHIEADYCFAMDIDTASRRLAELGNPTRLQIVRLLVRAGRDGLAIGELQARLGVPASTLAFHLRGLVTAGFVEQEKQGRSIRCTIDSRGINATLAFVKENCCAGFSTGEPVRSRRASAAP
jgi:ArsR family transcriptional regulator